MEEILQLSLPRLEPQTLKFQSHGATNLTMLTAYLDSD
jgi:hypothetical protein